MPCEVCDITFKNENKLKEHMDQIHNNKESNNESETQEEDLNKDNVSDIEIISDEAASIDVASESNGSDLPKADEKTYKCDKCNFKSSSDHGIKIHKAKKHSASDYYNSLYALSPRGHYPPRFPPRFPHNPMW